MVNINDLLHALDTTKHVIVKFKTKAGTIRVMDCTRMLSYLPKEDRLGINNPKLNGPDIICIYDHLIREFRAFRKDSIIAFESQTEIIYT